jgi:glycosyltransferase involved in cell wall biosynthesis
MTARLLQSPLREEFQLIHFDIGKKRSVESKGRFDLTNLLYGLWQPLQLAWILRREKPRVLYTNLAQNLGGFLRYASFILVARGLGTRVVVRVMGSGFDHFYRRSPAFLQKLIRGVLRRVDRVMIRGQCLAPQFEGIVPESKLRTVYLGIDPTEFDVPSEREKNQGIQVLFVGYLSKAKGALDLLQAAPLVVAQEPQTRFLLMGSRLRAERNILHIDNPTDNEAEVDRLITEHNLARHVEFLGVISGRQKVETFVNADIFILPSYSEAAPVVVFEAMAAGLPVVATPVGMLPEVFDEQHILYVPPGDPDALAERLLTLIRDPALRRKMGEHNQATVRERFNLSTYAAQVGQVIREAADPEH